MVLPFSFSRLSFSVNTFLFPFIVICTVLLILSSCSSPRLLLLSHPYVFFSFIFIFSYVVYIYPLLLIFCFFASWILILFCTLLRSHSFIFLFVSSLNFFEVWTTYSFRSDRDVLFLIGKISLFSLNFFLYSNISILLNNYISLFFFPMLLVFPPFETTCFIAIHSPEKWFLFATDQL